MVLRLSFVQSPRIDAPARGARASIPFTCISGPNGLIDSQPGTDAAGFRENAVTTCPRDRATWIICLARNPDAPVIPICISSFIARRSDDHKRPALLKGRLVASGWWL